MTFWELLICVTLISISAFLSASEIALFSLSRFQLRSLKENFRPVYRKIKNLLSDPSGLLITILVFNEILNVALSSIITSAVTRSAVSAPPSLSSLPPWTFNMTLGILITTPILLFFCEITPKVIGARANQVIASLVVRPMMLIYECLKPLRFVLTHIMRFIAKKASQIETHKNTTSDELKNKNILKESDFLLLVEEGHKEGAIQESELELIKNVFELDRTSVAQIATPISQVLSLSSQTTVKEALTAMRSQRYSRIPIFGNSPRDIVGILYLKDLLRAKLQADFSSTKAADLMRKPFFATPTMQLNTLFRKFKQQKIHMAIIKNPEGEITGVITMSDILDALFEDLYIESDQFVRD